MNILVISDSDFGGAGSAALRLHMSLSGNGHQSALLVRTKMTGVPGVISVHGRVEQGVQSLRQITNKLSERAQRFLNVTRPSSTDPKYYFFDLEHSTERYSSRSMLSKIPFLPEVIIPCFISKFTNVRTIAELQRLTDASIVWYLFDMELLTGGCHYAWECSRYRELCGQCPALFSTNEDDRSRKNLRSKLEYTRDVTMAVVAASDRLYRQCLESSVCRGRHVHKVLLAVDPNIYLPGDRDAARKRFGLPGGKKVIFAGASDLNEERKGTQELLRSLEALKSRLGPAHTGVVIMLAGSARNFPLDQISFEYRHVGILEGDEQLAAAYQAADVFVCPSVEDSGPMMINESLMCGTPVVSFDMGVARDLVLTGETGYRAVVRDSQDMAAGIRNILSLGDEEYADMRNRCRAVAIQHCHPDAQAAAFGQIFRHLRSPIDATNGRQPVRNS